MPRVDCRCAVVVKFDISLNFTLILSPLWRPHRAQTSQLLPVLVSFRFAIVFRFALALDRAGRASASVAPTKKVLENLSKRPHAGLSHVTRAERAPAT